MIQGRSKIEIRTSNMEDMHTESQKCKKTWHTNKHLPHRRKMILRIMRILRILDPIASPKGLPHIAKYIEQLLYRNSISLDDYNDEKSLEHRTKLMSMSVVLTKRSENNKSTHIGIGDVDCGDLKSIQKLRFQATQEKKKLFQQQRERKLILQRQHLKQQREKDLFLQEEKRRQLLIQRKEKDEIHKLLKENEELRKLKLALRQRSLHSSKHLNLGILYPTLEDDWTRTLLLA